MEKIILALLLAMPCTLIARIEIKPPTSHFWPPDLIPHPSPPEPEHDDKDNWADKE